MLVVKFQFYSNGNNQNFIKSKNKWIHISHKSVSIDLFNLPPLPDKHNKEESYMDMPYNYYIPDGKNSRLLDRTDRVESDRETIEGNTGFQLEIPYSEYAFQHQILHHGQNCR